MTRFPSELLVLPDNLIREKISGHTGLGVGPPPISRARSARVNGSPVSGYSGLWFHSAHSMMCPEARFDPKSFTCRRCPDPLGNISRSCCIEWLSSRGWIHEARVRTAPVAPPLITPGPAKAALQYQRFKRFIFRGDGSGKWAKKRARTTRRCR